MPLDAGIWADFSADPHREPELRASDADRSVVFDALGDAFAAGLLDPSEYDDRLTAAGSAKVLGDVVPILQDIVAPSPSATGESPLDARTARALERLKAGGEAMPTTPEEIDTAARAYYSARVRREALGLVAGPVGICLAIWGITSIAAGVFIFFWPLFVILGVGGGFISTLTRKEAIIAEQRARLTKQARAALGDPEAQRELERRRDEDDEA